MEFILAQLPEDGAAKAGAGMLGTIIFVFIGLFIFFSMLFVVGQQDAFIIQRLGKFHRVARAGLNIKIPFLDLITGKLSLRIRELDIPGQFKTSDNVFVTMVLRVQYSVIPERAMDAFYKLQAPEQQITAFVLNVVRGEVAKMQLRDVFEHQDTIGTAVNQQLSISMSEFGFLIRNALVNEVRPAEEVVTAMNRVQAAENEKTAAKLQGEAAKFKTVLHAEAEAEAKRLQGEGIAAQREAIVRGLSVSVESLRSAMPTADPQTLMNLVLINQYFDAMRDISQGEKAKVIFVPSGPGAYRDISDQLFQSFINASEASSTQAFAKTSTPPAPPKQ
jgi:regulator of protease activity HflC (stomatin/prohibitin superfamily)